jgi:hypothetical protein
MNGIYGRAATGLQDSSWAVNEGVAKVGAKGEQKTEALLNGFGKKAAVLHDCGSRSPASSQHRPGRRVRQVGAHLQRQRLNSQGYRSAAIGRAPWRG